MELTIVNVSISLIYMILGGSLELGAIFIHYLVFSYDTTGKAAREFARRLRASTVDAGRRT
jgi:hypothetical protein